MSNTKKHENDLHKKKISSLRSIPYFFLLLLLAFFSLQTISIADIELECQAVYCVCNPNPQPCGTNCEAMCSSSSPSYGYGSSSYSNAYQLGQWIRSSLMNWFFGDDSSSAEQIQRQALARQRQAYLRHLAEAKRAWKALSVRALQEQEHLLDLENTKSTPVGGDLSDLGGLMNCHEVGTVFKTKQIVCEADNSPNGSSADLGIMETASAPKPQERHLKSQWERLKCARNLSKQAASAPNVALAQYYSNQATQAMTTGNVVADCGEIPSKPEFTKNKRYEASVQQIVTLISQRVMKSGNELATIEENIQKKTEEKEKKQKEIEELTNKIEELKQQQAETPSPTGQPTSPDDIKQDQKKSAMAEAMAALKAAKEAHSDADQAIQKNNEMKKNILKDLEQERETYRKVQNNPSLAPQLVKQMQHYHP